MSDRRAVIVRAADTLLAEQGLDGLTIRAVLTRTDLARRAFYDLFPTKDDLMLALFEHAIAEALRQMAGQCDVLPTPEARLGRVIALIAAPGADMGDGEVSRRDRRSAAFSQEHLRLAHVRPRALRDAVYPLVALIRDLIAQGVEVHGWQCGDPERAARFVYNLVSTTVQTELMLHGEDHGDGSDRMALADQLTRFCLNGLSRF